MFSLLRKIHARCSDPRDFLCLLADKGRICLSAFWGSTCLRCKAAIFGIECSRKVCAVGNVILARAPQSRIRIGDGVSLISCPRRSTAAPVSPVRLKTFEPTAEIILERGVELSGTSVTARSKRIRIGAYTMIAPGCILTDSDFHAPWPPQRRHLDPGYERDAGIEIGEHVWIGMNSLILKGVNIGRGSIVAAGSVVVRSLPENCLAAGVPASVVKIFSEPQQ